MFGFLPSWVGDTLTLIALVLGTPGLILYFLGKKDANRKLVVEEGGLTVDQFNAALPAYKDLLDRANNDRDQAVEELKEYKQERIELLARVDKLEKLDREKAGELGRTSDKLEKLRRLFQQYVDRVGIPLTTEELAILDNTQPPSLRHRRSRPRVT